jgi:glycosyltransferase involved in cell wall biosynthesis
MIYRYPDFVCAVTTFEPFATMRFELLERTVRSMRVAFPDDALFIFDNGSADGSHDAVAQLAESTGALLVSRYKHLPNRTPGAARACLFEHFLRIRNGNEIAVLSDDDMVWHPDARKRLREVWHHAPDKLQIVGGLLEPEWEWNKPIEAVDVGSERILLRESAPGAAWTLPISRMIRCCGGRIEPVFGYDVKMCKWLRAMDFDIGQMDLADHIGWEGSTHGNRAIEHAMPLDRKRWGV